MVYWKWSKLANSYTLLMLSHCIHRKIPVILQEYFKNTFQIYQVYSQNFMILVTCFEKFSYQSLLWSMRSGMVSCMAACFALHAATRPQTFLWCFFQSNLWHLLLQYQTLWHFLQTFRGVGMLEPVTKQVLHKSSPQSSLSKSCCSRSSNSLSANLQRNKFRLFFVCFSYIINLQLEGLL